MKFGGARRASGASHWSHAASAAGHRERSVLQALRMHRGRWSCYPADPPPTSQMYVVLCQGTMGHFRAETQKLVRRKVLTGDARATLCAHFGGGITAMQVLSLLVTLAQTVQHLWEPARPKDQLKHANLLHVTAVWQTFLQFNYKLQCRSRKRKNKLQPIYQRAKSGLYIITTTCFWKILESKGWTNQRSQNSRSILSCALFTLICNFLTKYC